MSLHRIPILMTDGGRYYVEKDKDFGVRFMLENEEEPIWQAAIMDCGDKYAFAVLEDEMIRITEFNPQNKLTYRNGKSAPLSVEDQIEVKTSHGKTIVVRYLYRNKTPKGVIVAAYSDGDEELTSLAISGAHEDYLCFSLSN